MGRLAGGVTVASHYLEILIVGLDASGAEVGQAHGDRTRLAFPVAQAAMVVELAEVGKARERVGGADCGGVVGGAAGLPLALQSAVKASHCAGDRAASSAENAASWWGSS